MPRTIDYVLNDKEEATYNAISRLCENSEAASLSDIASMAFPSRGKASNTKGNSWVRNSLRRLMRYELVKHAGKGVYARTEKKLEDLAKQRAEYEAKSTRPSRAKAAVALRKRKKTIAEKKTGDVVTKTKAAEAKAPGKKATPKKAAPKKSAPKKSAPKKKSSGKKTNGVHDGVLNEVLGSEEQDESHQVERSSSPSESE